MTPGLSFVAWLDLVEVLLFGFVSFSLLNLLSCISNCCAVISAVYLIAVNICLIVNYCNHTIDVFVVGSRVNRVSYLQLMSFFTFS